MTKNRLSDLNNHLFAQIERPSDESLSPAAVEREARRSLAVVALARQTIRNAALPLHAAKILHDHDGRDPTGMLQRFIDATAEPKVVSDHSLVVVRK